MHFFFEFFNKKISCLHSFDSVLVIQSWPFTKYVNFYILSLTFYCLWMSTNSCWIFYFSWLKSMALSLLASSSAFLTMVAARSLASLRMASFIFLILSSILPATILRYYHKWSQNIDIQIVIYIIKDINDHKIHSAYRLDDWLSIFSWQPWYSHLNSFSHQHTYPSFGFTSSHRQHCH